MTATQDFSKLSPFELKDELLQAAEASGQPTRDAGRGNPNFLTTIPREGFFEWGQFAMEEASRRFSYLDIGLGGLANKKGIEGRLDNYLYNHHSNGATFIRNIIAYVQDQLGYDTEDFIFEMTKAILGGDYPVPDRMLELSERVVKQFIRKEMSGSKPFDTKFDVFATEGGAAAMSYVFDSLGKNHLLKKGDKVAMGTPIFTPYLEIPELSEYDFTEIMVEAVSDNDWQYSPESLDKLLDPSIKAFFLVNPSNPASVKMSEANLLHLAKIIEQRPDLIVITDDVYSTFADDYMSIFTVCPRNTILVYSFSKYFGSTGWRLGVIAMAQENAFDERLQNPDFEYYEDMKKRYATVTPEPENLKLIDRMVADSRMVALNHVAGLSTPSQVQMVFFSLFALMDARDNYKRELKELVRSRARALYKYMGIDLNQDENTVGYYEIVEIDRVAKKLYGKAFSQWILENVKQEDALFRLASETGVVLLPASGFAASHGGFRVSLANLNESDYIKIGQAISKVLTSYHDEYLEEMR